MLFDAHGDILTDMYEQRRNGVKDSFKKRHLQLYKEGGITHSIFVNWTNPKTNNPSEFTEIFKYAFEEIAENLDIFQICLNTTDMIDSVHNKKIGVILGIEGLSQLESVNQMKELYRQGIRHASLTWNEVNGYAAGLDNLNTKGLTAKGKELLSVMEELGMIIDLAHLNGTSFDDVINHTKGPVIISHGNTKALCPHRRNYTDEQLLKIKEKNGVIGICGIMPFVANDPANQNVSYMAKHIDHAVKTIGIDHVGFGFDVCYYLFSGVSDNKLEGFKTMKDTVNVLVELQKLGYSDEDIEKIKYKNFFRVIKEVLG